MSNKETEAVKNIVNSVSQKLITMKFIVRCLFIILAFTNFVFNRIHYLQKIGFTIGTIYAPSYANIFMGKF